MEVTVFENKMQRLGEGSAVKFLFEWRLQIHNNEEESLLPSFLSSAYRPSHLPGAGCHAWREPFPTQTPTPHLTGTLPFPNICTMPDRNPGLPKHLHHAWWEPWPSQTPAPCLMGTLPFPNTCTMPDGNLSLSKHLHHAWWEPFPIQTPAHVPAFISAWCWVSHLMGTLFYPNTCTTPDGNPSLPKHLTGTLPYPNTSTSAAVSSQGDCELTTSVQLDNFTQYIILLLMGTYY